MSEREKTLKSQEKFERDPRAVCKYGLECYQKNPQHHEKFKHPPKAEKKADSKMNLTPRRKRKFSDTNSDSSDEVHKTSREAESSPSTNRPHKTIREEHSIISDSEGSDVEMPNIPDNPSPVVDSDLTAHDAPAKPDETVKEAEKSPEQPPASIDDDSGHADVKDKILKLFLVRMPKDFYKFYEFCCKLSASDPSSALKLVDLQLVGPYDVMNGKITDVADDNVEKYLKHWRYFYDPPEFQTILKGSDKEGLHYGYWRDTCDENPIFVARNSANVGYKFESVAPNIFGAVLVHVEEKLKAANPFQKATINGILQSLKRFAKEHSITLEKISKEMRVRDRKVVGKTINTIGIVVPYDTKTQLGYRNPCITDSQLLKIARILEANESDEKRADHLETIEEVVRYATIAADECDFGTPLKVGQDFFSSGVDCLAKHASVMLNLAYQVLKRPQFAAITAAHMKDRKKGCEVSVL